MILAYIVNDLAIHILKSHFELLSRRLLYSSWIGGYLEITQRLRNSRINSLRIIGVVLPSPNVKIRLSPYGIFRRGSCNDSQISLPIGNGICQRQSIVSLDEGGISLFGAVERMDRVRIGSSTEKNGNFFHNTGSEDSDWGSGTGLNNAVIGCGAGLAMVEECEYQD